MLYKRDKSLFAKYSLVIEMVIYRYFCWFIMKRANFVLTSFLTLILLVFTFLHGLGSSGFIAVGEFTVVVLGLLLFLVGMVLYQSRGKVVLFVLALMFVLNGIVMLGSSFLVPYALCALLNCLVTYPLPRVRSRHLPSTVVTADESVLFDEKSASVGSGDAEVVKNIKVETEFTPGKYVASLRSNQYHEPRCDWAKKIKRERQVWFKEKNDAWERGYRAHACVRE